MSTVPPGEFIAQATAPAGTFDGGTGPEGPREIVSRSPGRLAWERFKSDKKTVVAAIIVGIYIVLAILAPILVNLGVLDPLSTHSNLINDLGLPTFSTSWAHPFGVEPGTGRDVLSRVWFGLTFSLFISAVAAVCSVIIGVILGIIAGLNGGWADTLIGRLIDLVLSFPQTLMLLALSSVIVAWLTGTLHVPSGNTAQATYVILVLAVFGWPPVARVVRGQVLSLREREFIDAARLLGAGPGRLYFREVLPNLWAPILVQFTLILPAYVSAEAALSYLSISIQPPTPTLGNILKYSIQFASSDFVFFIAPAFLLVLIVVSFNLLGDGLRDALDPKATR
ncbi:ABC transporter permease [Pseudolysinimonas sp.]|uniref:ABC transporter permease n=1 Tax=Pseudolysinimonas sp. TaxID=2680009 RepID=UPI003F7DB3B2